MKEALVNILAVIGAAVIGMLGSLVAICITTRQSRTTEFNKHRQAILKYRFDKLYSLLESIIIGIGYISHKISHDEKEEIWKNGIKIQGKTYEHVMYDQINILLCKWLLAEPLIDSDGVKATINGYFKELYEGLPKERAEEIQGKVQETVIKAIQEQLTALLGEQRKHKE